MLLCAAFLAMMTLQSCNDDKDLVVITEELPLKVDHLYMVGDATPAGWSIDNPTPLVKDKANTPVRDKILFIKVGSLINILYLYR